MQREQVDRELSEASFEFFFWFSRFEFALKENGFLKNKKINAIAEPNWQKFTVDFSADYELSVEGRHLLDLHPKRQYIAENGELDWKPVGTEHCNRDLCRVTTMLTTVRNNLFHGGKHGDDGLDSKARNLELLRVCKNLLDELAVIAGFTADYERRY